ncbi:MAG: KH domain-containing protein, partial [Thermoplasmata archaeon]|nr:KH domain-containing protein [Thermoplasmata archaeon]
VGVESIENTGRIGVTMLGDGLGKLEGGTIVSISPARVPRVIGRGGSMVQTITELTDCKVAVGQNGRIWIDGPDEGIIRVRECLRMIDEEGHKSGLTERIQQYLESTATPGSTHDHRSRAVGELPHGPGDPNAVDLPTPPPLDLADPASRAPAEETDTDLPPDY